MEEEERRSVEASGRTVDEALEKALEDLGAAADQVQTQILTEGSRGLLGLGGEEARVRVTLVQPEEPGELPPAGEDVEDIALDVLRKLLRHMGVQAQVVVREPDQGETSPIVLDVTGDDLGILIGRQGETLRDVQYIARLIVSRKLQRWVNLVVDVGGYKRRRERILTQLAHRMAERVVAEGRPMALEPMPPHERRIVHIALRGHELVRTESTGEGRRRKVVILPKEDL
jgi:spoIIIJ-associated protein